MARKTKADAPLDRELAHLPPDLRWRTWMGRVEAVVFAAPEPVGREVLASLVGEGCRLDELLADIREELRARPYELVKVAGEFQLRTRVEVAEAVRASGVAKTAGPSLSRYEMTVLAAIAYFQPITRTELGRFAERKVSRDTIASLRQSGLIGAGPRAPQPGAPATYITTPAFLATFGLDTLRDLPDMETLEDAGLLDKVGDDLLLKPREEGDDGGGDNDDEEEEPDEF